MFYQDYYIIEKENAKFSGIFDTILQGVQAGISALPAIAGLFGGGGSGSSGNQGCNGQAKGLNAIRRCSAMLLSALDALLAQVGQQPYQAIIDSANKLVNALSDPTYFYQAQRGDDARVLNDAKAQAQQKLQQIIAAANQAANNPTGTAIGQAGQVISSGGNVATSGLDSIADLFNEPIVLYGTLGLLGYLLIIKAKK